MANITSSRIPKSEEFNNSKRVEELEKNQEDLNTIIKQLNTKIKKLEKQDTEGPTHPQRKYSKKSSDYTNSDGLSNNEGNQDSNNSIFIYKNQSNQIAVNIPSEIAGKACVSVFNAVGQKFESKQLNSTVSILENSYTSGIYLVSVISNGKTTTRKVVIN